MTTVLAGECPECGQWVGVVIKEYDSPGAALTEGDWPDLECRPVECCGQPVWPTHFLVIYRGGIVSQTPIGGQELPVTRRGLQ